MRSEFEFIDHIRAQYGLKRIGDDCAVLPKDSATDLVITADLLVEDIDFRLDWTTPEFLGHKALAVSLSDIAAMGANPTSALLTIGVPKKLWKTDFLDGFYAGWHDLAVKHGVELVGGDISRSPDKFFVDSTVLGDVPKGKAVFRSGANPGDLIFVTGFLGGAAAGLDRLSNGVRLDSCLSTTGLHLLLRQLQPISQVTTGNLLREYALPVAMLDISDGLSSDIEHLARASGVGVRLDAASIPIDPAIFDFPEFSTKALDLALHGGEDFELLFAIDPGNRDIALDLGFHQIGEVTDETGATFLVRDGTSERLEPSGFRHF